MRPKIQWCLPVFFLVACASTGKPLVDLTTLVDPAPNPSIVRFEATNPFNRLYVGPVSAIDQPEWLEALKALRERDRKVLAQKNVDSVYERAELAWTQTSFIETPLMIHDRFLYDPATHHYTADRLLSDLKFRYGGAETVVLWQAYPNLGIDERNQYDFFRDLPGGIAGLKSLIAAFHRRGVKVILPFLPWDNGTRPEGEETRAAAAAKLVATTGADGLFGDSMAAPGPEFLDAGEKLDHVFALEPEGGFGNSIQAILWAPMSWANWSDYQSVPGVDRYRWIEPRFMNHVGRREAHSHLDELQYAWFNGAGFLPWENVWGTWNGITPRDAETIRRMAMIYRAIPDFVRSANWEPHSAVLQSKDVYASKWSLPDSGTVWTFINRGDEDLSGPMLEVNFRAQHFYNLWTGEEIKPAEKLINRLAHKAQLELSLDAHGFGAVLETNEPPIVGSSVARLLPAMRARKNMHIFSSDWVYTPQRMVDVPATAKFATAPAGMIRIPGIQGWDFSVTGIENGAFDGADVQYPWESHPQLVHQVSRDIATFYLDQMPVTNQQFQQFLDDHGYTPADSHNFLRDWDHGRMPPAIANKAVT
ncbi:MAG: SUMF1/EgtB/PvdO family nonheme iron enzyme [Bdellovibrionota bacterium]